MSNEALERGACPLCSVAGTPTGITENGFRLERCGRCRLLFVSPRPRDAEIRAIYEHDAAHTASRQLLARSRDPQAVAHARYTLRLLRPHQQRGMLLEIGAGAGLFMNEARRAGYAITAVEPNPVQAVFMAKTFGIQAITAALGSEALEDRRFDVVYHCNVLSHFPDPVAALALIRSRLRPGGILLMETGNFADVDPRFYRVIARTERFQLPDHLYFFGERSLRLLLERTGFAVRRMHRYSRIAEKHSPRLLQALHLGRLAYRFQFLMTYRIGRWLPKRGRPQTLIVVAAAR
jgi:SAM-dependent methyltransferase